MRVYVPNLNKEGIGGGNTFIANFRKHTQLELTDDSRVAQAMFVPNPMWAERSDFEHAKQDGIPVILRLDNIPEDWNNRGTAITKLTDFINASDVLIYQSEWARVKYEQFCNNRARTIDLSTKKQVVIHNGVDTELFTPEGPTLQKEEFSPKILFVKSSRNENKRYPEAMETFRRYHAANPRSKLYLVGQFADDYHKYNFGFYNGEHYEYLGMPSHEAMPIVYRSCDVLLFPAYADCAPNVVLEAMACGVVPVIHGYGGGAEFLANNSADKLGQFIDTSNKYPGNSITSALGVTRPWLREHVLANFDIRDCVKKYEEVICH
jgi:glycosyltransferase involved in cell wall biosynthesis